MNDRLEQRIAELEAQRDDARKTVKECHELAAKRIAELEAQVPKVVKPVFNLGYYDCPECEHRILPGPSRYCSNCGSKLNWEEA